jgi:hypothetical protein
MNASNAVLNAAIGTKASTNETAALAVTNAAQDLLIGSKVGTNDTGYLAALTNGIGSGCTVTSTGKTFYVYVVAPTGTAASVDVDLQDHKTNATAHADLFGAIPADDTSWRASTQTWNTVTGKADTATLGSLAYSNSLTAADVGADPSGSSLAVSNAFTNAAALALTALQVESDTLATVMGRGNLAFNDFVFSGSANSIYKDSDSGALVLYGGTTTYASPSIGLYTRLGVGSIKGVVNISCASNSTSYIEFEKFPNIKIARMNTNGLDMLNHAILNATYYGSGSNLTDITAAQVGAMAVDGTASNVTTAAILQAGAVVNIEVNGTTGTVSGGIASVTIAAGGGSAILTNWVDATAIGVGLESTFPTYQIRTNANGSMPVLAWDKTVAGSWAGPFVIAPASTNIVTFWQGYHSTTGTTAVAFRWRNGLNAWSAITTSALQHATGSLTSFDTLTCEVTGLSAGVPIEAEITTISTNSGTSGGYHYMRVWGWTP